MYKEQKLKKCPKCGEPEGLINCPVCHKPGTLQWSLRLNEDWRIWRGDVGSHNTQESTGLSEGSKDTEDV